jgi:Ser/Thr protein kinase RdoA (MazF antagonist)
MVDVLLDLRRAGRIPEMITHSDTKLNNVMIDDETQEGICVIDLDTVMPGLSLYDFGDMVRTAARPTAEDETDLSKVEARLDMFDAITRGYLASAGDMLTPAEIEHLAFSARLITFEIGIRFLTDYLQGDVYFKTHREGHNRDRCRVQFKMVDSFERNDGAMRRLVADVAEKRR